ncbi:MAG TPA: molybdopterin-dependent oxidoreductase [Vicinamibacterales bacterium]|nr:molybdopterin-dependent oxidoreductase [Vicinamibacterales bacterium]
MKRRDFIKLTAITGTTTALASCGNPEHQFIRFVPDEELTPGIAEWRPSVCALCASGCGLTVRVMDADVEVVRDGQAGVVRMGVAKKLEGVADHPVNHGGLCPRGQAGIQVTYHPDRITRPLKRKGARGEGSYDEISWDDAIAELVRQLDALASAGDQKALAFIKSRRTGVRSAIVDKFAAGFGAPTPIVFELFGDDVLRRANALSYGYEQLPTYDLARSNYVISFGADFLSTWNSPVAHGFAYGEMRRGRPGVRGSFIQVESRMTQTGANADEWVPVKPGTEGVLALGIAHVILKDKLRPADAAGRAGTLIAGWSAGLPDFAPEKVLEITGVSPEQVAHLAHQLVARRPSMAFAGGPPLALTNGLFTAVAVNALNALVGSINEPGGIFFTPQVGPMTTGGEAIDKFAARLLAAGDSPVKALILDGGNPVFASPSVWKMRDALQKVPFIASFANFVDETTSFADLILPDHSYLESWVDAAPESGSLVPVVSVAGPAMKPLYPTTRAMADVLLDVASKLQKPISAPKNYEEALKTAIAPLAGGDPDEAWFNIRKKGGWWPAADAEEGAARAAAPRAAAAPRGPAPSAAPMTFAAPTFDGDPGQFPYHFLPYASPSFVDGSVAHLPWLQELPDPLSSAMWSTWIEVNPATADALGIHDNDVVEVASQHGTIQAAAILTPGIAPDVIGMPVGQGHTMFTRYATNRGANPVAILAAVNEPQTGAFAWASTRVKLARVSDPDGRLILHAGSKYEKPNEGER